MWIKDKNGNLVNTAHLSFVQVIDEGACKVHEAGTDADFYIVPMPADELFERLKTEATTLERIATALEALAGCVNMNDQLCVKAETAL